MKENEENEENNRLRRNIRIITAATASHCALFMLPVIVPYYTKTLGLSFGDFMVAQAAFAATILLFEIPTSWISDVWRRKTALMCGLLICMAGHALLALSVNLVMAVLSEVIMGIGYSMLSGTWSAMVYEHLLSAGKEAQYVAQEGRRRAISYYCAALSCLSGGVMYAIAPRLPFACTMLAMLVAMVILAFADEPARHRKRPEKHPLADIAETIRYSLNGHPETGVLVLYAAIMFSTSKMIMWTQQPYYMALHIDESLFGILVACGSLLAGAASHSAHHLGRFFSNREILLGGWIAAISIPVLAGIHIGWHGVALLMLGGTCIYGLVGLHVNNAINARTGSERRATVLSTSGMGQQLVFIPLGWAIGKIVEISSITYGLLSVACWISLAGAVLAGWTIRRHRRVGLAL